MNEQFARTELLLGGDAMERLSRSRVAVFGIGGVGGYVVEGLARSGIGAIDLIDNDTISITNVNRQLAATHSTIGEYKVDIARTRILDINPDCQVNAIKTFFLPENSCEFDFSAYDYVVDAVDTVTAKLALIQACQTAGTPVISSMGTGNKLDPTAFEVADIHETSVCPLARVMRSECRKRGIEHLKVVYSKEVPLNAVVNSPGGGESSRHAPGSVAFVPSVAGMIIAGEVVKNLIES